MILDDEQVHEALEAARELARLGIPIFVAPPAPDAPVGFALPEGWQQTAPDPAVVDRWQPGWALCAVMGRGLDLIDVDPRSGGDLGALNGTTPKYYAVAATPSAGVHLFIASTGSGSRDGVFPGIDVKSGMADGSGRGFAFLSPTVRPSKVTGEPAAYRWAQRPDIEALSAALTDPGADTSGEALAARIRALKADVGVRKVSGPDWWRQFATAKEPQSMAAAEKAISAKLAEVAGMSPESGQGQRQIIMRAAMTLGGYVGSGYLAEGDAEEKLLAAIGEVWPDADEADRLWIRQGLTDGAVQPFYVYTPEQELDYSEVDEAPRQAWNVYTALGGAPFDPVGDASDQGMAEAVAGRMYPVLRYAADAGTWLVRDAEVWREREDMASWAISTVARLMPRGDTPVPKDLSLRTPEHWQAERRARFMDSGRSGKIERKLKSIVRNADHLGSVELGDLDAEPEILWAGGRAWDLRASVERPVPADLDPATPHLRTASVVPEHVPTPTWDAFTAAVWADPELRAWALRVLSISLTGYPDAALPVLYGPERTGKTALVQLLVNLLGSYGHAADPRLLSPDHSGGHASIVYVLKGRRLSFIDEGPRRGHPATERLKQLTGGGSLTGNAMRANPITFNPTHTLVMTTNDEPPVRDPALLARMRIIACEGDKAAVRAARQAITPTVWRTEAPGVLAVLMGEAAAWLADQDSAGADRAPSSIRDAVEEMAASQNPAREWVENCTVPANPGTPGRELYRRFAQWFEAQAIYRRQSVPSETMFGRTLTEMGFPGQKLGTGNDRKVYRPLSVFNGGPGFDGRAPWEPAPAADGGRVVGGLWAGSGPEPAQSENPSSTPVSSSSWEGWEGTNNSITHKKNTHTTTTNGVTEKSTEKRGASTLPDPTAAEETSADQPRQSGRVDPSATRPSRERATPPADPPFSSQIVTKLIGRPTEPREPSNAEVAARAYQGGDEKKISKAEARAQLKEEARRAAILEASGGESVPLPAAVNRLGGIFPMSTEDATATVRALIIRDGALTVDVETTGYPIGHADYALRTVQLGATDIAIVFDPTGDADAIRTLLAEAPKLHAHSATADLVPLADAGLVEMESGWDRMFDTVIPAKLADPSSTGSDPGLKQLASAVLGADSVAPAAEEARKSVFKAGRWLESTKVDTPIARSGWAQIDPGSPVMLRYAASDVLDTAALARALPTIPDALMGRERLAQRLTARVTHRGVRLDYDHVREMTRIHTDARAELSVKVREMLGVDNPGSDTQIAKALQAVGAPLKISAKGNPSAAKDELQKLARTEYAEVAQTVLDFRHHDTVLGTFLHPYATLCERGDGRARPTIYTLGTDTGRMSCVRPNLQQPPREGGTRACIVADPGQLMIGADFSGVEIRVAAALSQDPTLLQLLAEGRDLHAEVAKQVWGESAGKAERYIAKRIVFGRLYGGGVPTLAAQAGISESIAQSVIDNLDALTPVLSQWSAHIRNMVKQGHTQYPSYSGRIIHFPREYPHKAPNYCVGMNTPVLRSDLTHVAASKIQVGDRLVGFDEHPQEGAGGMNRYHHMRTAVVEAVSIVVKPSVKVRTADGKVTECSTDHLWLVRPLKGRKNNRPRVRWMRADELQPGDDLLSLGTWDVADSRTGGYLAGLYDGEGTLSRHAGGRRKNQLFFSQNRGVTMDAMQAGMTALGLPFSYYHRAPNSTSTTDSVVVSGLRDVMRTLGTLQPARFRPRFEGLYEGNAITAGLTESVAVTAIEPAGELELASIQTSTRTLVANGYLSHNCIQGTARELLVDTLERWSQTRWGNATVLPVHDELDAFVPAEEAEEATAALVECMRTKIFGVKIVAEPSKPSAFWADSV